MKEFAPELKKNKFFFKIFVKNCKVAQLLICSFFVMEEALLKKSFLVFALFFCSLFTGRQMLLFAEDYLSWNFDDCEIKDILYSVSLDCGISIVCDDSVSGKGTLRFAGSDFENAFNAFLKENRLYVCKEKNVWTVSKALVNYENEIDKKNVEKYGGSCEWSDNPDAVEGADFIYTDVWYGLYDKETPKEVYMADFYPKYQVNDEMMAATENPNCKFLHCLPATRNEEVTDSVLDSENSLAWDEAENRLTAQRGLLLYFSGVAQATLDYIKQQKEAN